MRRAAASLACGLLLAATGFAARAEVADAHTLILARATARAELYVRDLALRVAPTQDRGHGLTGCRRLSVHALRCGFYTLTALEPPLHRVLRCEDAVDVFYATPRSSVVQVRPIGLPRCSVV